MAGSTPFYGLAFFDFGDKLDAPLNVQKEIDRFVLIDKQLFGLYQVFGNGVIDGWIVEDNGFSQDSGISISISPGIGIINSIAAETTFPVTIESLPANSTLNVFAILQGDTVEDRVVDFTVSTGTLAQDFAIKIAEVVTGNAVVSSIDNDARTLIGFKQIIKEEIDAHKHRGTPSKIDLQDETRNQLPGAKIADLDASKVSTGVFPVGQIPMIDHESLENSGLLTHAQLDSFVQTLSENNKELLGEIASVNAMKSIIFLKYLFPDADENWVNSIALIPGISSNELIDFDASTANINLIQRCISGLPAQTGEFVSVFFESETAFLNAFKLVNVDIVGDTVLLQRDTEAIEIIENFEGVSGPDVSVPGFTNDTIVLSDSLSLTSESADTLKTEGFFSGQFNSNRTFRAVFTKDFTTSRDWSDFDELLIDVKTISVSHGPVFAQFVDEVDGEDVLSDAFLILAEDELTDNNDPSKNNFAEKVFDIGEQSRGSVKSFVIFTDDVSSNFEFFVDHIRVQNTALFKPQGTIRFRFSSSASIAFHSIIYDIDTPEGTSALVRAKVASSASLLTRAPFTFALSSGSVFALPGSDIEIEVTLLSNADQTLTPTLNSIELRMVFPADHVGFNIDTRGEWSLGDASNIQIVDIPATSLAQLEVDTPINVGGIFFSFVDAIRELDDDQVGVFGFSGNQMPIAPPQALDWTNNPFIKFEEPVSVMRRQSKNYVIADRDNDRVFEVDNLGNMIKGFGSVQAEDVSFYPFGSVFNANTKILTVVMSKTLDRASVDLTEFLLTFGQTQLSLSSTDTVVESQKSEQILEILLSNDKAAILSGQTKDVFLNLGANAFAETIEFTENASALFGVNGVSVFVGDFTYMDGIQHPVFANVLDNGNWIVANSSIFFDPEEVELTEEEQTAADEAAAAAAEETTEEEEEAAKIASILEFNPSTLETIFSSSSIEFSDFSLGSILEQPNNRIAVAGIFKDPNALASQTSTDGTGTTTDETEDPTDPDAATATDGDETPTETPSEDSSGFDRQLFRSQARTKLSEYRGIVAIIEKTSGAMVFKYLSPDGLYPSDVDQNEDNDLIVAESSFAGLGGRVIILDNFGNILRIFGDGTFTIVNDAKSRENDNIVISM